MTALAIVPDPDEEAPAVMRYEFDEEFQSKIVALALRDTKFAQTVDGLLKPEYMISAAEGALIDVALRYFAKYKKAPDLKIVPTLLKEAIADKRIRSDVVEEVKDVFRAVLKADISDRDFVAERVAAFARERAVEEALMASVGYLEKGGFDKIEKAFKEALMVGISEDTGEYDYFERAEARTEERIDIAAGTKKKRGISTGNRELDNCLYHGGWGYKELSVLMGAAKAGKSMALLDFAQAAALLGFNVLYTTLEVSAEICADRLDANIASVPMKKLGDSPHTVKAKVDAALARSGKFIIKEYPSGTMKPSQLRRLLANYRARGIKFDLIVVDYGDIMAPEYRTDSVTENSKSIYLDLRAIAQEEDAAVLTATQTNRAGAGAYVAKATDIAEDYNKVRIADLIISINASQEERDSGEARLYFAAIRNAEDGYSIRIKQQRDQMKFLTKVLGRE